MTAIEMDESRALWEATKQSARLTWECMKAVAKLKLIEARLTFARTAQSRTTMCALAGMGWGLSIGLCVFQAVL